MTLLVSLSEMKRNHILAARAGLRVFRSISIWRSSCCALIFNSNALSLPMLMPYAIPKNPTTNVQPHAKDEKSVERAGLVFPAMEIPIAIRKPTAAPIIPYCKAHPKIICLAWLYSPSTNLCKTFSSYSIDMANSILRERSIHPEIQSVNDTNGLCVGAGYGGGGGSGF